MVEDKETESLIEFVYCSLHQEKLEVPTDKTVITQICKGEHKEEKNGVKGFLEAYRYLHRLVDNKDAGLLDNNLICDVHKLLMDYRRNNCTIGCYSDKERVVEFEGKVWCYVTPHKMFERMQIMIDQYNNRWNVILMNKKNLKDGLQDLFPLLAWLIHSFLELHPFGDGNGRVIRLLYAYILEAYGISLPIPIFTESYNQWCHVLISTRMTGDFMELQSVLSSSFYSYCQYRQ